MKFQYLIVLALAAACSHSRNSTETSSAKSTEPAVASPVAQQVAKETQAALVTEVSFHRGSAQLTAPAKRKLEQIINDAKARGKIDDIKVIAWSDQNYPSKEKGSLVKQQRDLADKRSDEVQKYVKNYAESYVDVDTYNMAERPGTFESWFNTSDNRIKKSLENAGVATTADGALSIPNKRSTAMILVVLDN